VPFAPDDDEDEADALNEVALKNALKENDDEEEEEEDDELYEDDDDDDEWDPSAMPFLVGDNPQGGGAAEIGVDVLLVEENGGAVQVASPIGPSRELESGWFHQPLHLKCDMYA
jgi:hypothetical protein